MPTLELEKNNLTIQAKSARMSTMTNSITKIESVALDILNEVYGNVNLITPPIDLAKIAQEFSLKVFSVNFVNADISGYYNKPEKEIWLSDNDPSTRQRFTLAHELGHYFLHSDREQEVFYRSESFDIDSDQQFEQEANVFAASLLMPRPLVVFVYFNLTKKVDEIAKIFKVSFSTATNRLKNLGLYE